MNSWHFANNNSNTICEGKYACFDFNPQCLFLWVNMKTLVEVLAWSRLHENLSAESMMTLCIPHVQAQNARLGTTDLNMLSWCENTFSLHHIKWDIPNSKVHGANMGSIWGRQDPGGPHVGIWCCVTAILWDGFLTDGLNYGFCPFRKV